MKKLYSNKWLIIAFLAPALIFFVGILLAPIFISGYYSLFGPAEDRALRSGLGMDVFVGLKNYKALFDPNDIDGSVFLVALKNSSLLAFFSVVIQLPLALFLAMLLAGGRKGEKGFMSIYFMPVLISTVIIGQLWIKIYNPDYGVLNAALRALGLESWTKVWLGDLKNASVVLGAVFVPTIWQYVGYHMLLLYAGIKSVPPEYREAAKIDGANEWQVNRYIVLPYIKPIMKISVIFAVTGSFKSYDLVKVLTDGGPAKTHYSEVLSTFMIRKMFENNMYGMGSAIAFLLIILCFAAALIIGVLFKDRDKEGR